MAAAWLQTEENTKSLYGFSISQLNMTDAVITPNSDELNPDKFNQTPIK